MRKHALLVVLLALAGVFAVSVVAQVYSRYLSTRLFQLF